MTDIGDDQSLTTAEDNSSVITGSGNSVVIGGKPGHPKFGGGSNNTVSYIDDETGKTTVIENDPEAGAKAPPKASVAPAQPVPLGRSAATHLHSGATSPGAAPSPQALPLPQAPSGRSNYRQMVQQQVASASQAWDHFRQDANAELAQIKENLTHILEGTPAAHSSQTPVSPPHSAHAAQGGAAQPSVARLPEAEVHPGRAMATGSNSVAVSGNNNNVSIEDGVTKVDGHLLKKGQTIDGVSITQSNNLRIDGNGARIDVSETTNRAAALSSNEASRSVVGGRNGHIDIAVTNANVEIDANGRLQIDGHKIDTSKFGRITSVAIDGNNNDITAKTGTRISVNGNNNDVSGPSQQNVTLQGNGNDYHFKAAAPASARQTFAP